MNVILNGTGLTTTATTLAELLREQNFGDKVATARNGAFVARSARDIALAEGDVIEVLSPMQGG